MDRLKLLREEREKKFKRFTDILDGAKAEKREVNEEESKELETLQGEIQTHDSEIGKLERCESFQQFRDSAAPRDPRDAAMYPQPAKLQRELEKDTLEKRLAVGGGSQRFKTFDGKPDNMAAYRTGQFIAATFYRNQRAHEWCLQNMPEYRAMSSLTNTAGGYLIPDEWSAQIIRLTLEYGVFDRFARRWPMGSDTLSVPRRTGGITSYFAAEASSTTESSPTVDMVSLSAKKLMTDTVWPTELSDDAMISIADFVTQEIALAHAIKHDQCGFIGNGSSTYGGMRGACAKLIDIDGAGTDSAGAVNAAANHDSYSEYDVNDFLSVVSKAPRIPGANYAWHCTFPAYAQSMGRILLALNGNSVPDVAAGMPLSFLGYPVIINNVMNSDASTTDHSDTVPILFADLGLGAAMGVRREISIKVSDIPLMRSDSILAVSTHRFDINVHECGDASNAGVVLGLLAD